MILDLISNYDNAYKELQDSVAFNDDTSLSLTIMKLKGPLHKFLFNATIDCYLKNDLSFYEDAMINNLNWFKKHHTKKELIKYISSLND